MAAAPLTHFAVDVLVPAGGADGDLDDHVGATPTADWIDHESAIFFVDHDRPRDAGLHHGYSPSPGEDGNFCGSHSPETQISCRC